jgi:hypothetical protein
MAIVSFALTCSSRPLFAQKETSAPRDVIRIWVDSSSVAVEAVVDAVRAHLQGLEVDLEFEPATRGSGKVDCLDSSGPSRPWQGGGPVATFCIERDAREDILISLTEATGTSTLVRRVPRNAGASEAALEEAGIIVRAEVEAVLDGARVGLARPEGPSPRASSSSPSAEPKAPREAAAPVNLLARLTPETPRLSVRADYVGSSFSSNLGWQSGIDLGVAWSIAGPLYVGADYAVFPSMLASGSAASILLARHPAHVALGWHAPGRLSFAVRTALEADLVTRETVATGGALAATPATSVWMFAAGARAGVSWSAVGILRVEALGGLDAVFDSRTYVVADARSRPIVSAATLRPGVDVGVGIGVW